MLPSGKERTVRIVHEHFALDANGKAPDWIGGVKYAEQAAQKRAMYEVWMKEDGSSKERVIFFETRSSQIRDGSIWTHLQSSLQAAGIRVGTPQENIRAKALTSFREASELEELIIDFVLRFKDSGFTKLEVENEGRKSENPNRAYLFLKVAFMVFDAYQEKLRNDGQIDFADMLREAIKVLSSPHFKTPYRFVLVDEFQDISKLKADLVKAVLDKAPDTSIVFCVGDDWQTINRFAGSDVSIFTNIADYFQRHTKQLELTKTFRCAQGIADVSRALVMTNPKQIDKDVKALAPRIPHGVRVRFHGPRADERRSALIKELERLVELSRSLRIAKPSVYILRRTTTEKTTPEGLDDDFLKETACQFKGRLEVILLSTHKSKGLEADFAILPGLDSGFRGFPDERPTEPLFDLVLPTLKDSVEEERRLLYVGITRARHQAIILTNAERPSTFVLQLEKMRMQFPTIEWVESDIKRKPCPKCALGSLYIPHEKFTSPICSRRVACGYQEGRKQ